MSNIIAQNALGSALFSQKSRKYAVRLRLKRTFEQKQANQSSQPLAHASVSKSLRSENKKLQKNINKLSVIGNEQQSLSINLKKSFEFIKKHHNQSLIDKKNNEMIALYIKRFKQNLKAIRKQMAIIINYENAKKDQQKQDQGSHQQRILQSKQFKNQNQVGSFIFNSNEIREEPNKQAKSQNQEERRQQTKKENDNRQTERLDKTRQFGQRQRSNEKEQMKSSTKQNTTLNNSQLQHQYGSMIRLNAELQAQSNQMQNYIISLKQEIAQKQRCITQLEQKNMTLEKQCRNTKEELKEKNDKFAILEQQLVGYQNKVQQLQMLIQTIIRANSKTKINANEDFKSQDKNRAKGNIINSIIDEDNIEDQEQVQQEVQQYQIQQMTESKKQITYLQTIYKSTQNTIKKCKQLEQQLLTKEKEIEETQHKLEQIVNLIYETCNGQQGDKNVKSKDKEELVQQMSELINSKQLKIEEQFNDRQSRLSHMIAEELNQALKTILRLSLNVSEINKQVEDNTQQWTIIDKIQYIKQTVQYIFSSLSQQSKCNMDNNTYFNTLISIYSHLQNIIAKSDKISSQVSFNNNILGTLIEQIQKKEQALSMIQSNLSHNANIIHYIGKLQELLSINQTALDSQSISQIASYEQMVKNQVTDIQNGGSENERGGNKVEEYLTQLQDVIKNIYKIHHNKDQILNQQEKQQKQRKVEIKKQIKQASSLNESIISKMQELIRKIRRINSKEDIKSIEMQLMSLSQKIKQQNSTSVTESVMEKMHQQSNLLRQKYFPSNPQFVQIIISKLLEIRRAHNEQSLLQITDSLFSSIKNRDDKYKHEMGRRKQIMKQRTTAIAQICKKGIKDHSVDEKYNNKRQ